LRDATFSFSQVDFALVILASTMPTAIAAKPAQPTAEAASEIFDPRVDAYINKAPAFARPILEYLREAVHTNAPGVTETMKWSRPFFELNGSVFGNMSAFKEHCSFGFWSSRMTELLAAGGIDGAGSSGSLGRISSMDDLPPRKVFAGYVKAAARLVAAGEYGPGLMAENKTKTIKAPLPVPAELTAALAKSKLARANFDALPPSCRREYIDWITSAKRPETREKRLTSAMEMISANRRMNDQYK
jgi:uncharacterized protein YdeI (YjbR/CyaY-like superfamily)